jgi:hypothetical protein
MSTAISSHELHQMARLERARVLGAAISSLFCRLRDLGRRSAIGRYAT